VHAFLRDEAARIAAWLATAGLSEQQAQWPEVILLTRAGNLTRSIVRLSLLLLGLLALAACCNPGG